MTKLSIKEKEYWRESFNTRIRDHIRKLETENSTELESLRELAETRAIKALGLTRLIEQRDEAQAEIEKIKERADNRVSQIREEEETACSPLEHSKLTANRKMTARVKNIPLCNVGNKFSSWDEQVIDNAIVERTRDEHIKLQKNHPIGKQILELDRQQDSLLDAIWLATSSDEMVALWKRISELLGLDTSGLCRDVLKKA